MIRLLAIALAATIAASNASADVIASLVLAASGVDDGVAPVADVWGLSLENTTDLDVTSIGLDITPDELGAAEFFVDGFTGTFLNPSALEAENGTLPAFRGAPITHTFAVLPEGLSALETGSDFSGTGIVANYTTAGGILIPADSSAIVAHISVPTGTTPADLAELDAGALGSVVFADNSTAPIITVPEPTTAILAALGLAGFVARRK